MKIIVVGGGTAGWWTAGYLAKFGKDYDITLIESPNIPKIGVGESVLPQTYLFFEKLGMKESEWMPDCEAVYKLGNLKQGWYTKDDEGFLFTFWWNYSENILRRSLNYRDGAESLWKVDGHKIGDYWLDMYAKGEKKHEDFIADLSDSWSLAEHMCQPIDNKGRTVFGNWAPYAYHINAYKASEIVKDRVALPLGVKQILAEVTDIKTDGGDNITSLTTDDGSVYTADLFIDCTGFSRSLVNAVGRTYKQYPENRVNSAWVAPFPYLDKESELEPYTQSLAKPYGWQFKVTLTSRIGTGYVFDDRFLDTEQAKQDFLDFWPDRKPLKEPRLIKWTPSRLNQSWKGNLVAVGLANYFIDPLEANAVYGIEFGVEALVQVLERGGHVCNEYNARLYSRSIGLQLDYMGDFLKQHYLNSTRTDSDFWKHYQDLAKDKDLEGELWKRYKNYANPRQYLFPDSLWLSMAMMFRRFTNRPIHDLDPSMLEHVKNHIAFTRRHSEISATMCKKIWE
jgi:tryptophan halogenase